MVGSNLTFMDRLKTYLLTEINLKQII